MKPFLRWVGGKTKFLPELMKHVPDSFDTYYEPFLGGGALFLHLASTGRLRGKVFALSDANADLINAWRVLRDVSPHVIMSNFPDNTEEDYMRVRASNPTNPITRAVRFLYLNATCFNGLYRENKKGQFNVPYGKRYNLNYASLLQGYTEYHDFMVSERLTIEQENHRKGSIITMDFAEWRGGPGRLFYFDPPYVPISKTSNFTAYGKDGFGMDAQRRLAHHARSLADVGSHVVLSNSSAPEVWDLYGGLGAEIHTVTGARSVGASAESRASQQELIIVFRPAG